MAIYRGPGGAGDATTDSSTEAAAALAAAAAALVSQNAAAASASAAATSATNASNSATAASNAKTAAELAETNAETAEANAETAQSAAEAAQTAAELAETNAETAKANAETAEANANASAALSQEWATKTSGPVAGGEYSSKYNAQLAATSATNAANSATSASTSASAASTSATNASNSASAASASSVNAANSATTAAGSATSAASSASTATTQSSNAANSATAAATSASSASTSATNAAASATSSFNSASTATTQATNASNSASAASASAMNAANSATASATSATNASNSASAALISENLAEDWATKTTGTVDGVEYSSKYYAEQAAASIVGALQATNNLSDLDNVVTARTNLGLGTAAITDSTTYATAAQGTKADTAYGWGNHASVGYAHAGANTDITSMSSITGGISTADYIDLDTAATPAGAVGRLSWDDGNGTAQFGLKGGNVTLQVGQELVARVYNDSGSSLTDGQIVYISGAHGNRISVKLAKADNEATSAGTLGMVTEPIAAGAEGFITIMGTVNGLNTSALTAGQLVYLSASTAGAYTTTAPTAPNHRVTLGYVERVNSTVGSIYVKVDNGYELDELHNVSITSTTSGNTLIYDAVAGVWKNANLTDGTGITITEGAGSITISNSGVTSIGATSPIESSGGATPVISLASGYGDTQNPFASKTANYILAAPNGVAGAPTFRAIVAEDIPTLNQNTTGTASNVTGTVAVSNGGTGATTLTANSVILGNNGSTVQFVEPGANGNVLTSNGTTWTSAASSAGGFPSGTVMLFKQTSAPTGWTKDTTTVLNNSALRIVTGSTSSGGTVDFTTAFTSQAVSGSINNTTAAGTISISGGSVSATTLSETQIPSHLHSIWRAVNAAAGTAVSVPSTAQVNSINTNATGGGGSHTHGFTQPTGSFTGTAHNHTFTGTAINLAVKYVDIIIASKD